MSERRKPQFKKSKLVKILVILLIVAAVIAAALAFARRKVSQQFATRDENTVESVQVSVGEIGTSVSGSGTLSYEDSTKISVPQSVDITEVYVKEGQNVEAGEMLASVNSASVVQAMADVQKEMETLDADLDALGDEDTSETIKSTVSGRVKKVYVTEDDIISNVMYEHNALMLLSLDGKMALDIETDQVKAGDSVTVTVSDKDYSGTVDSVWAGKATITLTDNGPALNAKAKVKLDGKKIGSGKLYIHQELAVTGYTGKVSAVKVSENDSVSADQTLMTLTETSNTVNYATLLEQRAELEETLQNLITIYKEGAVYAKESGRITTYTEAAAATSTTDAVDTSFEMVPTDRMLLTLNVDETDILALEIGQTASITIDALGEDTYEGQVTDIDTVGSSSNGVTTFTCEITLAREEGMLRGMSGTALITIEGKSDALLLPSAAVTQMSDTSFVYTTYDEESGELGGMVEVVTGLNNSRNIEITSGLQEGDTVYYKEETTSGFDFSGMPGGFGGGDMPGGFSGGDMPSGGSAGDMPSGFSGGGNGGGMPSGGDMPSGFSGGGNGGGMPSGGGNGGGMPANAN